MCPFTGLVVSWEKKKEQKNKQKTKSIPATKREKEHLPLTDFDPAKRLFYTGALGAEVCKTPLLLLW